MNKDSEAPDYELLVRQLTALSEDVTYEITILANASALLYSAMEKLNWCGFYLTRKEPAENGTGEEDLAENRAEAGEEAARETSEEQRSGEKPSLKKTDAGSRVLLLGPFQGKTACTRIPFGKGVCGTAAIRNETVLVKNVHEFPGHIACDSASNSEIVVPIYKNGEVYGVLDIDSPVPARFSENDRIGLERYVRSLEEILEKF